MRGPWKLALTLALVVLMAVGFAACGADSDSSSNPESTAPASTEDQAGGSAGFRTPGGDNSIQTFGEEGDGAEVDAASTALAGYLSARAEDDWAKGCPYLARATVAPLEELTSRSPQFKGKGCAAALSALMGGTPSSSRADTMSDGIASLRVEGDRGFALYHGPRGVDYFVPMIKQGDQWRVGALEPTEFP
jgi:hypothetical protein